MSTNLPVYYTLTDVKEFLDENLKIETTEFYDIYDPLPQDKVFRLRELYCYYTFVAPCKKAITEFEDLFKEHDDLNNEKIRLWVEENRIFFDEHLMSFGNLYQNEDGGIHKVLYLKEHNLYIDIEPLAPVFKYWLLMWNLYWGQYYLAPDKRDTTRLDPNDYYYRPNNPDVIELSDTDVIRQILSCY